MGGKSIDTARRPYRSNGLAKAFQAALVTDCYKLRGRKIVRVVLSDRTIRQLLADGRIGIEPFAPELMQPSSLDVRVDRYFRVFRNSRYPYIDVKAQQEDLTELVEVEGDEAFILHPGEFVLGSTLERVTLPDDLVARLEGKALALDTEVPTTQGWREMAELRPGDLVFGPDGEPTVVVATTEPMMNRPCREVVFSDGTSVVCDVDHQWVTVDASGVQRLVTTQEVERSLVLHGEYNHRVGTGNVARLETTRATVSVGGLASARPRSEMWTPNTEVRLKPDPTRVSIVAVREVPSVPVRCIQVSAPSGQFLVTRAYIATHNSSLGRLGLLIHSTAGFIDPGWDGHVTLELSNVANLPITIYPEMKIGQLSFVQLSEPAERPYGSAGIGSKYQGQRGPTPSRYWQNFSER
jgi:deoxycytidine triphosphate deaminase